jgi:hypothetical protein
MARAFFCMGASRPRRDDRVMPLGDVLSVAIALAAFALLYALIELVDRV